MDKSGSTIPGSPDSPLRNAARTLVLDETGSDGFAALSDGHQERFLARARVIAEIFREPTSQMVETGLAWLGGERDPTQTVKDVWRAMADALIEGD
jgi:hypothetical protein